MFLWWLRRLNVRTPSSCNGLTSLTLKFQIWSWLSEARWFQLWGCQSVSITRAFFLRGQSSLFIWSSWLFLHHSYLYFKSLTLHYHIPFLLTGKPNKLEHEVCFSTLKIALKSNCTYVFGARFSGCRGSIKGAASHLFPPFVLFLVSWVKQEDGWVQLCGCSMLEELWDCQDYPFIFAMKLWYAPVVRVYFFHNLSLFLLSWNNAAVFSRSTTLHLRVCWQAAWPPSRQ